MLQNFEKNPYKVKELLITYRPNAGRIVSERICTGIIVYCVETDRIYLIGENVQYRQGRGQNIKKSYAIILLDQILSVAETGRANTGYDTPEYHRIFRKWLEWRFTAMRSSLRIRSGAREILPDICAGSDDL